MRTGGKEAWILAALLALFVVATAFLTQRGELNQRRDQPTTYSTGRGGTKALLELLGKQGFLVERFERPSGPPRTRNARFADSRQDENR